ncbi:MAG: hypothetical protein QM638_12620 [Nocardioides sp.]|uniref:type IV toxin-antitoxin system AbiEi family antitoxin domain-containing protein n=1 Tax=Nocardioides sp. TaxID=35761 RepID=UPI0039E2E9AF
MDIEEMRFAGSLGREFPLPIDRPFTGAMATDAGISRRQLERLLASGLIRRTVRGVYLATEAGDSIELRARCLALVAPDDCVIVDRHAGWLHGASMVLAPGEHIGLRPLSIFRPSGKGRLRNHIATSGERWLPKEHVTVVGGMRVTTPLRTAWDLGRVPWPNAAISAIDQMHRLGRYRPEEFNAGIEQFRGHRWVRTLRVVGPMADGRAESPPESILRILCRDCRVPVVPQLEVFDRGRFVARLDLGNEELRFALEYDGLEWHSAPEALERDRNQRQDLAEQDWLLEIFTKEDLFVRTSCPELKIRRLYEAALRRRGHALPRPA